MYRSAPDRPAGCVPAAACASAQAKAPVEPCRSMVPPPPPRVIEPVPIEPPPIPPVAELPTPAPRTRAGRAEAAADANRDGAEDRRPSRNRMTSAIHRAARRRPWRRCGPGTSANGPEAERQIRDDRSGAPRPCSTASTPGAERRAQEGLRRREAAPSAGRRRAQGGELSCSRGRLAERGREHRQAR